MSLPYFLYNREPERRTTVMFMDSIPVHCPGHRMSYWFRRMLQYWLKHGEGSVRMAHRYGGGGAPKGPTTYKRNQKLRWTPHPCYTYIKRIAARYAYLNPHLIRESIGDSGLQTYVLVWKERK